MASTFYSLRQVGSFNFGRGHFSNNCIFVAVPLYISTKEVTNDYFTATLNENPIFFFTMFFVGISAALYVLIIIL